ncbi:MAG TPA: CoA ester lyase [Solirubrobacteraceae bacterium]|jgi:citrate lyase subunit beta/citryl-CoA lyase|nr:CoA ester lyase [Solirubrobacteraceae bacterium]
MVSLVVPGSSERMLAKARELKVDELIFDLEDAVTPDRKPEALRLVLEALSAGCAAARTAVRINPIGSEWAESELRALSATAGRLATVVVPKATDPDELGATAHVLGGMGVQALIETAAGLSRVDELAAQPGVEALILGYADLAVSLGRPPAGPADLDLWLPTQERVLVAARAAGVRAIDGPFLSIDDANGLRRSASRAAELGFDGKWAIHPAHVQSISEAFRPDDRTVQDARAVLAALRDAPHRGAVQVNGQMVDEPVRQAALRTLERAGLDPEENS